MADRLLLETGDRLLLEDGTSFLLLEVSSTPETDPTPYRRPYNLDGRRTYRKR